MGDKKEGVQVIATNTHHYLTPKGNRYTFFKNRGQWIKDLDDVAHFATCGGFNVLNYEAGMKKPKKEEVKIKKKLTKKVKRKVQKKSIEEQALAELESLEEAE